MSTARYAALLPEARLVVAATHPFGDADRHQDLPRLRDLDPALVLAAARLNKVVPRVFRFITARIALEDAPEHPWADGMRLAERLSSEAAGRHNETIAILRDLHERGIAAAPLKGTFLSQRLYGDPTLRQSSDIDLLVHPHRFRDAFAALLERGYELRRPAVLPAPANLGWLLEQYSNYNIVVVDKSRGSRIELHWRLTHYGRFPDERSSRLWDRFEEHQVSGVSVIGMSTADLLLYLAVHGTKDQWRRLSWLTDFAHLATRSPDAMEAARTRAAERGLAVVWAAACRLSDEWYGTALQPEPRSALHRQRVRYLADNVSLMRSDPLVIPGGARRYDWNSHDSRVASFGRAVMSYVTPSYAGIQSAEEFEPGLQRRRRAGRALKRVLKR